VLTGPGGFLVFRAGEGVSILEFPAEGYSGAPADLLPGGTRVAIGRNDGTLELWSVESGEVERSLYALGPLAGAPTALWAADDGETLYAGAARGVVGAWRVRTGSQRWFRFAFDGPVTTVVPLPRAGFVLASDRRTVVLLGVRTGDVLVTFALDGAGNWVAATPDGYHVASGRAADALLGLRFGAGSPAPVDRLPFRLLAAGDPDFGILGGALDALRVTLLGAAEPASGDP
jgi:WD40 repeat protein